MTEHYLEIRQNGKIIYRMETSRPISLSNITLTSGTMAGHIDVPEVKVDCDNHVEPARSE